MYRIGLPPGADFSLAANHDNARGITCFIDVDAKVTGLLHRESDVGSIDFDDVAFMQFANAEVEAAFGQADLRNALVEVQERESGHAAKMQSDFSGLQFGAGILVDPHFVANGHGAVTLGATPVTFPARL